MDKLTLQLDFDRRAELTLNRAGEVVKQRDLYLIRPFTAELRRQAARQRGRDGFSFGKAVCVLPSARFAARDRNRSVVTECEAYRDEED